VGIRQQNWAVISLVSAEIEIGFPLARGSPSDSAADAALRNLSNLLIFLREREYSPEWRR